MCSALGVDEIEQASNIIRAEYRHDPPVDITEDVASFPSVKPVAIFLPNHPELKKRAASAFRGKPPGQPIETSNGV